MLRRPFPHLRWSIALCVLLGCQIAAAQSETATGFIDRVFQDAEGEYKYVLFVPENYSPKKKWPVVLYLHGAGERGDDGRKQVDVGMGPFVAARRKTFPFIAVFPQAKNRPGQSIKETWSPTAPDGQLANAILDSIEKEYAIDTKRRILTGWSMGGYGVWQQAAANPKRWSAIVPVSGGGNSELAAKIGNMPIWAFHGADDAIVKPDETRALIAALKAAGRTPRYSEITALDHNAFKVAYDNDALYQWMLQPTSEINTAPLRVRPGLRTPPIAQQNRPFRPALIIPRALVLQVGSDALKSISYTIPHSMPANLLSGGIGDIHDTTVAAGRTFNVTFHRIQYYGRLQRAYLETTRKDRLRLRLGLENLRLQIGGASVRGSGRSASAGPMSISIGNRRPVWLNIEATPYVAQGQVRLRLQSIGFRIPNDNWSVSPPTGIRTSGLGMTQARVRNGLVRGLYGSKSRIESEVRAIVPTLLRRIESQLSLGKLDAVVAEFWPLPVYKPQLRLYPEQITVDASGVMITMGMMAAAIDPSKAPRLPKRVEPVGIAARDMPRHRDLRIHVAASAVTPLTDLLVQSDLARIHVDDIPQNAFAPFADRDALAAAIPDLAQLPANTQIWSEFILTKPLSVSDAESADKMTSNMQLDLPQAIISTAIKVDPAQATWQPYAEFQFSISQGAAARSEALGFRKRYFVMDWTGEPSITTTARFAAESTPANSQIQTDKITALFEQCWKNWSASGPVARRLVDDVKIGKSTMRLSAAGWSQRQLYLAFSPPGTRLTNSAETPLVYEARGPYSPWGGPYTLPPKQSHEFDEAYPVSFRRRINGRYRNFTLPIGTHSEFRIPRAGGSPRLFQAREPTK